jgi:hypothetical protein
LDNKEDIVAPTVAGDIMQPARDSMRRLSVISVRGNTLGNIGELLGLAISVAAV